MLLFHTGFQMIEKPDIKIGRANADFGQGFYLSDDEAFSRRWARERKGQSTYLNCYELDARGLRVKRFSRDAEWFDYIFANRANRPDDLTGFDVIIGPVANDTIYDTWGIITSGVLDRNQALQLLMLGPSYTQVVLKTEKAADALVFKNAVKMDKNEIDAYRAIVSEEERQYQEEFAKLLSEMEDQEG